MTKRGMPGVASGNLPPAASYSTGHKQIAHEMVPSPGARAQLTGGDAFQRSIGNYAKQTPADASGVGQMGLNVNTMGR